jgi:hypothetical protein
MGAAITAGSPIQKDACRVYQWLIDEAIDSKGNRIVYTYKAEDGENVDDKINEINRSLSARKYIHSVQYVVFYCSQHRDGSVRIRGCF